MFPPHLPPPTCNIANHHKWQRLKILAISAVFGLAAGMSGAAVMLGWIWPGLGDGDIWAVSRGSLIAGRNQLDERIRVEVSEKIFSVYQSVSGVSGINYLAQQNKLGEAVAVTSDGWLVMYSPNSNVNYRTWQVLDDHGAVYKVSAAFSDHYSGLLFLKLVLKADAQLKVIGFAGELRPGDDVFIYQGGIWRSMSVQSPVMRLWPGAHLDSAPTAMFPLSNTAPPAALTITSQGRLAGFVNSGLQLLPDKYASRQLTSVLSQQKIFYSSLGVDGWFDGEQPLVIKSERQSGFLVTRVWSAGSKLVKGDIILEINGQVVTPDSLWYNVSNQQAVKLKVLRKGKITEIETKIITI